MASAPFQWTSLFTGRKRIYMQIAFWILIFALYIILKERPDSYTGVSLICIVLQEELELAIPCYTQNLLILPLFRRRKWVWGVLAYLVQIFLLITLLPYLLNAVAAVFASFAPLKNRAEWRNEHIGFSMVAFTLVATAFRLALDRLMMEKDKKETELRQLKAQLNPHFLFNTLNNLYGLAVVKSEKLPTLMLKLSDLLRYSLYETGRDYVPLGKELIYVADYIDLERIRVEDQTTIGFETAGTTTAKSISPLTLISFVENAFKHFSAARNEPSYIKINVRITADDLHMTVRNSLDPLLYLQKSVENKKGGIGMTNVRERLRLLYPGKHTITVIHVPEYYDVDLKIRLTR